MEQAWECTLNSVVDSGVLIRSNLCQCYACVSKEQPNSGRVEGLSDDKLLICNTLYSSFEHAHIAQLARARDDGCYLIQSNLTQQKGKDFCSRRFFCSKNKEGCPYAVTYRFQNGQCRLANHNRLLQYPHTCERLSKEKCSERIRFYLNKYKDLLHHKNVSSAASCNALPLCKSISPPYVEDDMDAVLEILCHPDAVDAFPTNVNSTQLLSHSHDISYTVTCATDSLCCISDVSSETRSVCSQVQQHNDCKRKRGDEWFPNDSSIQFIVDKSFDPFDLDSTIEAAALRKENEELKHKLTKLRIKVTNAAHSIPQWLLKDLITVLDDGSAEGTDREDSISNESGEKSVEIMSELPLFGDDFDWQSSDGMISNEPQEEVDDESDSDSDKADEEDMFHPFHGKDSDDDDNDQNNGHGGGFGGRGVRRGPSNRRGCNGSSSTGQNQTSNSSSGYSGGSFTNCSNQFVNSEISENCTYDFNGQSSVISFKKQTNEPIKVFKLFDKSTRTTAKKGICEEQLDQSFSHAGATEDINSVSPFDLTQSTDQSTFLQRQDIGQLQVHHGSLSAFQHNGFNGQRPCSGDKTVVSPRRLPREDKDYTSTLIWKRLKASHDENLTISKNAAVQNFSCHDMEEFLIRASTTKGVGIAYGVQPCDPSAFSTTSCDLTRNSGVNYVPSNATLADLHEEAAALRTSAYSSQPIHLHGENVQICGPKEENLATGAHSETVNSTSLCSSTFARSQRDHSQKQLTARERPGQKDYIARIASEHDAENVVNVKVDESQTVESISIVATANNCGGGNTIQNHTSKGYLHHFESEIILKCNAEHSGFSSGLVEAFTHYGGSGDRTDECVDEEVCEEQSSQLFSSFNCDSLTICHDSSVYYSNEDGDLVSKFDHMVSGTATESTFLQNVLGRQKSGQLQLTRGFFSYTPHDTTTTDTERFSTLSNVQQNGFNRLQRSPQVADKTFHTQPQEGKYYNSTFIGIRLKEFHDENLVVTNEVTVHGCDLDEFFISASATDGVGIPCDSSAFNTTICDLTGNSGVNYAPSNTTLADLHEEVATLRTPANCFQSIHRHVKMSASTSSFVHLAIGAQRTNKTLTNFHSGKTKVGEKFRPCHRMGRLEETSTTPHSLAQRHLLRDHQTLKHTLDTARMKTQRCIADDNVCVSNNVKVNGTQISTLAVYHDIMDDTISNAQSNQNDDVSGNVAGISAPIDVEDFDFCDPFIQDHEWKGSVMEVGRNYNAELNGLSNEPIEAFALTYYDGGWDEKLHPDAKKVVYEGQSNQMFSSCDGLTVNHNTPASLSESADEEVRSVSLFDLMVSAQSVDQFMSLQARDRLSDRQRQLHHDCSSHLTTTLPSDTVSKQQCLFKLVDQTESLSGPLRRDDIRNGRNSFGEKVYFADHGPIATDCEFVSIGKNADYSVNATENSMNNTCHHNGTIITPMEPPHDLGLFSTITYGARPSDPVGFSATGYELVGSGGSDSFDLLQASHLISQPFGIQSEPPCACNEIVNQLAQSKPENLLHFRPDMKDQTHLDLQIFQTAHNSDSEEMSTYTMRWRQWQQYKSDKLFSRAAETARVIPGWDYCNAGNDGKYDADVHDIVVWDSTQVNLVESSDELEIQIGDTSLESTRDFDAENYTSQVNTTESSVVVSGDTGKTRPTSHHQFVYRAVFFLMVVLFGLVVWQFKSLGGCLGDTLPIKSDDVVEITVTTEVNPEQQQINQLFFRSSSYSHQPLQIVSSVLSVEQPQHEVNYTQFGQLLGFINPLEYYESNNQSRFHSMLISDSFAMLTAADSILHSEASLHSTSAVHYLEIRTQYDAESSSFAVVKDFISEEVNINNSTLGDELNISHFPVVVSTIEETISVVGIIEDGELNAISESVNKCKDFAGGEMLCSRSCDFCHQKGVIYEVDSKHPLLNPSSISSFSVIGHSLDSITESISSIPTVSQRPQPSSGFFHFSKLDSKVDYLINGPASIRKNTWQLQGRASEFPVIETSVLNSREFISVVPMIDVTQEHDIIDSEEFGDDVIKIASSSLCQLNVALGQVEKSFPSADFHLVAEVDSVDYHHSQNQATIQSNDVPTSVPLTLTAEKQRSTSSLRAFASGTIRNCPVVHSFPDIVNSIALIPVVGVSRALHSSIGVVGDTELDADSRYASSPPLHSLVHGGDKTYQSAVNDHGYLRFSLLSTRSYQSNNIEATLDEKKIDEATSCSYCDISDEVNINNSTLGDELNISHFPVVVSTIEDINSVVGIIEDGESNTISASVNECKDFADGEMLCSRSCDFCHQKGVIYEVDSKHPLLNPSSISSLSVIGHSLDSITESISQPASGFFHFSKLDSKVDYLINGPASIRKNTWQLQGRASEFPVIETSVLNSREFISVVPMIDVTQEHDIIDSEEFGDDVIKIASSSLCQLNVALGQVEKSFPSADFHLVAEDDSVDYHHSQNQATIQSNDVPTSVPLTLTAEKQRSTSSLRAFASSTIRNCPLEHSFPDIVNSIALIPVDGVSRALHSSIGVVGDTELDADSRYASSPPLHSLVHGGDKTYQSAVNDHGYLRYSLNSTLDDRKVDEATNWSFSFYVLGDKPGDVIRLESIDFFKGDNDILRLCSSLILRNAAAVKFGFPSNGFIGHVQYGSPIFVAVLSEMKSFDVDLWPSDVGMDKKNCFGNANMDELVDIKIVHSGVEVSFIYAERALNGCRLSNRVASSRSDGNQ